MYYIFSKLKGLIYGQNDDGSDAVEVNTTRSEILSERENARKKRLKGTGIVSPIINDICHISNEFEFSKSKFHGFRNRISELCEVSFQAEHSDGDTNWTITSVQVSSESEVKRTSVVVAIVTDYDRSQHQINIKADKENRILDASLLDFLPTKGDYLRVYTRNNGIIITEGDYIPRSKIELPVRAEPTKQKMFKGTVTRTKKYLGIDGNIYFDCTVTNNRTLNVGDTVSGVAIESNQDVFSWRAISIQIIRINPREIKKFDPWEEDINDDTASSPLAPLFTFNGIVNIQPAKNVHFKDTRVNDVSSAYLTISLLSMDLDSVILKQVRVLGDQNVCNFDVQLDNPGNILLTKASPTFTIEVLCSPRLIGLTKDLIVFEFDGFTMARFLNVNALPPIEDYSNYDLTSLTVYSMNGETYLTTRRVLQLFQQSLLQKPIKGANPFRPAFFESRKMPFYHVPDNLLDGIKNRDENMMQLHYGYAKENLTFENYKDKFNLCIWLEEIAALIKLTSREIKLSMRTSGRHLVLPLTDVHESIISHVHCGDKIRIRCPIQYQGVLQYRVYEGTVYERHGSDIYAQFHETLHQRYNNETVKVEFVLGRNSFRQNHFAMEMAHELFGKSFLFPSEEILVAKPVRIHFQEGDVQDNDEEVEGRTLSNPLRVKDISVFTPKTLKSMWNTRAVSLKPVEYAGEKISWNPNGILLKWVNKTLNVEQKDAVRRILRGQARPLPYIIYGPPGTGKTVTVVEAVIQIFALDPNARILVTAPSNAAADLIAEKLIDSKCFLPGDIIRLIGFLRLETGNYSKKMTPYIRTAEDLDLVIKHRIVVTTCSTAGKFTQISLETGFFTHVFIDEAGYCHEPEALLPSILVTYKNGGQVILAGDPNQLGPVLNSSHATQCGLSMSLLERLMKLPLYRRDEQKYSQTKYNPILLTKLVKNYRAHAKLLKIPSELFYDNELEACAAPSKYILSQSPEFLKEQLLVTSNVPITFHGVRGNCEREIGSTSWFNNFEATVVVNYVKKLVAFGVSVEDIGIITPYRAQVSNIKQWYKKAMLAHETKISSPFNDTYNGPKVGSVEEFQGGERKVIIYSTVRSDIAVYLQMRQVDNSFVLDAKRFNVSLTRAQSLLFVVGNPHALVGNNNWFQFLKYCVEIGAYKGCDLPIDLEIVCGGARVNSLLSATSNSISK